MIKLRKVLAILLTLSIVTNSSGVITLANESTETVVNTDETVVNEGEKTVSEVETSSSGDETVVSEVETVVSEVETVVSEVETVINEDETVASEVETVVSEVETVANEDKTVVTEDETVVNEDETVVNEDETVVNEDETVVNENETVVNEDETVVNENETSSIEVETEDVNAEAIENITNSYDILESDGLDFSKDMNTNIIIRVDAEHNKFKSVYINGKYLDEINYTSREGSTIIELKNSYLSTLDVGTYDIEIKFEDGICRTEFKIVDTNKVEKKIRKLDKKKGIDAQYQKSETVKVMYSDKDGIIKADKLIITNELYYDKTYDKDIVLNVNTDKSMFIELSVDGVKVDKSKYTVDTNSITIKKDYVQSLSNGKHTITTKYNNGTDNTILNIDTSKINIQTVSIDNVECNTNNGSELLRYPDLNNAIEVVDIGYDGDIKIYLFSNNDLVVKGTGTMVSTAKLAELFTGVQFNNVWIECEYVYQQFLTGTTINGNLYIGQESNVTMKAASAITVTVLGDTYLGQNSDSYVLTLEPTSFANVTFTGDVIFGNYTCVTDLEDDFMRYELTNKTPQTGGYSNWGFVQVQTINTAFSTCRFKANTTINNKVQPCSFQNCEFTNKLILNNLDEIGYMSFYRCRMFNGMSIENTEKIGQSAFYYCTISNGMTINNIKNLRSYAFMCTTVNGDGSIELNDKLQNLGEFAFLQCTLKNTDMKFKNIGVEALPIGLLYCTQVKSIDFDCSLKRIESSAMCATSIQDSTSEFKLPRGLESIGYGAFANAGLKNADIIIPSTCKQVHASAFIGAYGINKITLEPGVEYYGDYCFERIDEPKYFKATFGGSENGTIIGLCAFDYLDCRNIENEDLDINFIEGVRIIGKEAFSHLGYELEYSNDTKYRLNLEIPASCEYIGFNAFDSAYIIKGLNFKDRSNTDKTLHIDEMAFLQTHGISNNMVIPDNVILNDLAICYDSYSEKLTLRGNDIVITGRSLPVYRTATELHIEAPDLQIIGSPPPNSDIGGIQKVPVVQYDGDTYLNYDTTVSVTPVEYGLNGYDYTPFGSMLEVEEMYLNDYIPEHYEYLKIGRNGKLKVYTDNEVSAKAFDWTLNGNYVNWQTPKELRVVYNGTEVIEGFKPNKADFEVYLTRYRYDINDYDVGEATAEVKLDLTDVIMECEPFVYGKENIVTFKYSEPETTEKIDGTLITLDGDYEVTSDCGLTAKQKSIVNQELLDLKAEYIGDTVDLLLEVQKEDVKVTAKFHYEYDNGTEDTSEVILQPNEFELLRGYTATAIGNLDLTVGYDWKGTVVEAMCQYPCDCFHRDKYDVSIDKETCTQDGLKEEWCNICDTKLRNIIIPMLGHNMTFEITVEPTCIALGNKRHYCTRNDYEYNEDMPALGHDPESLITVKEPTCLEDGLKESHCKRIKCKILLDSEAIPALGHDMTSEKTKEPTCTEFGNIKHYCIRNDYGFDEPVVPLGHLDGELLTVKEPTCTEKGLKELHCERDKCKVLLNSEEIDALGHLPSDYIVTKEPTCTEKGAESSNCKREKCLVLLDEREVPALGHLPSGLKIIKEPTCTEKGLKESKCTREKCLILLETEEIPALGHDYKSTYYPPTFDERGYTHYVCVRLDSEYKVLDDPLKVDVVGRVLDNKDKPYVNKLVILDTNIIISDTETLQINEGTENEDAQPMAVLRYTFTDNNGNFEFKDVYAGKYSFKAYKQTKEDIGDNWQGNTSKLKLLSESEFSVGENKVITNPDINDVDKDTTTTYEIEDDTLDLDLRIKKKNTPKQPTPETEKEPDPKPPVPPKDNTPKQEIKKDNVVTNKVDEVVVPVEPVIPVETNQDLPDMLPQTGIDIYSLDFETLLLLLETIFK